MVYSQWSLATVPIPLSIPQILVPHCGCLIFCVFELTGALGRVRTPSSFFANVSRVSPPHTIIGGRQNSNQRTTSTSRIFDGAQPQEIRWEI
jgi:hypothetical protein